jgi:mRNA-degrading endonuclease RelE of RelBE toxin-antitoxin system
MKFNIQTIPEFEKQFKKLQKKYPSLKNDLATLIPLLEDNPKQGIALGNDFYKIRMNITSKAKGKSGGARVITSVHIIQNTVYLASIYDKSDKSTISDSELYFLAKQIK